MGDHPRVLRTQITNKGYGMVSFVTSSSFSLYRPPLQGSSSLVPVVWCWSRRRPASRANLLLISQRDREIASHCVPPHPYLLTLNFSLGRGSHVGERIWMSTNTVHLHRLPLGWRTLRVFSYKTGLIPGIGRSIVCAARCFIYMGQDLALFPIVTFPYCHNVYRICVLLCWLRTILCPPAFNWGKTFSKREG